MTTKFIKYFTISVLLLFTLTSTGIPIAVHICKTMQNISFQPCSMCDNNNQDGTIKFTRVNDCCKDEVIAAPLKGYYLLSKTDNPKIKTVLSLIPFTFVSSNLFDNFISLNFNSRGNSPPAITASPLYLTNRAIII